jgi:membrane protein required for colicin V production
MDFAFLGWINKLAGGLFSVIKTILLEYSIQSFQKININNMITKEETLDNSIFYNPIKGHLNTFILLENWYNDFRKESDRV